jgi:3-oxoadipate enol-lactonase
VAPPEIELTVYPDECDSFGHLNQASFLSLFERARWEMLARGPGMDLFTRAGTWPAVRKATIEYQASAFPGDVLRFQQTLIHLGRTSFTLRQTALNTRDDRVLAIAECVFVCVNAEGQPVPVPTEFASFMTARASDDGTRRLTVNGVTLAVAVVGHGPAVLFIHGYPLDHSIWNPQLAALEGWTRVAPDLRGLGRSDAPDLGYSMTTYAEDLLALLDTLGCKEAVVCGHSMGGYIAFEILRLARQRVRGLILVNTRSEPDSADGKRNRDAAMAQAREGGASAIAEAMLPRLFAPGVRTENPQLVDRIRALMAGSPVAGILGALAAMRERPDSTPLLPQLGDLPTLVIFGADDELVPPSSAEAMADAIPGAKRAVVPGSAHLTPLERQDATTRLISGFLANLAG